MSMFKNISAKMLGKEEPMAKPLCCKKTSSSNLNNSVSEVFKEVRIIPTVVAS